MSSVYIVHNCALLLLILLLILFRGNRLKELRAEAPNIKATFKTTYFRNDVQSRVAWFEIFLRITYAIAIVRKILKGSVFFIQVSMGSDLSASSRTGKGDGKLVGFIHEEYYVTYSGSYWPTVSSFCGITDRFLLRKHGAQHSSQRSAQINSPPKNEIQYEVRNSCYPGGIDLSALRISRFDGDFRYRHPRWSRPLAGVIIPQAR